jgi:hypothetical protein
VRDAFAAWKIGMPAVVLVHEPFTALAHAQFQSLGAKNPVMLVYKQDAPARESEEEIVAKANQVAAEIAKLLECLT